MSLYVAFAFNTSLFTRLVNPFRTGLSSTFVVLKAVKELIRVSSSGTNRELQGAGHFFQCGRECTQDGTKKKSVSHICHFSLTEG